MTDTARYALPLLEVGQAQKEVTHNEAIARLGVLLHLAVDGRTVAAPPAVAVTGQTWIVAAEATGMWAGHSGDIAIFDDAGWTYVAPLDGCIAYLRDEQAFVHRAGGSWQNGWPVRSLIVSGQTMFASAPATIPVPTGGATIDAEARSAINALVVALRATGILTSG